MKALLYIFSYLSFLMLIALNVTNSTLCMYFSQKLKKTLYYEKALFYLLLFCSLSCFAQEPNQELFQTWYLSHVQTDDGSMGFTVSDITPNITPSLTILNDLTFNGIGACNSFNGEFDSINANALETTQFSNSTNDCGVILHNDFENEYFDFIQFVSDYSITPVENGLMLNMATFVFGQATFFNFQLNTSKFELQEIKVQPNPVIDILNIASSGISIEKAQIYDLNGRLVEEYSLNSEKQINVSQLQNGIYILQIETAVGILIKKLIKQ